MNKPAMNTRTVAETPHHEIRPRSLVKYIQPPKMTRVTKAMEGETNNIPATPAPSQTKSLLF